MSLLGNFLVFDAFDAGGSYVSFRTVSHGWSREQGTTTFEHMDQFSDFRESPLGLGIVSVK